MEVLWYPRLRHGEVGKCLQSVKAGSFSWDLLPGPVDTLYRQGKRVLALPALVQSSTALTEGAGQSRTIIGGAAGS